MTEDATRKELDRQSEMWFKRQEEDGKIEKKVVIVFVITSIIILVVSIITLVLSLFFYSVTDSMWFDYLQGAVIIGTFVIFWFAMIAALASPPMMTPEEFAQILHLKCELSETNEEERADLKRGVKEIRENPSWPYFRRYFNQL